MGRAWRSIRSASYLIVAVLFCLASSTALAQTYDNPGLGQKPVSQHPQDNKPLGIRAGSFMLHPGVELAMEWQDNILYTNDNELSDTIYHVRPYITAQSTWSRHSFNIRAAADVARYSDYGFRDYEDYFLQANGTVDVTGRSVFSYGLDYMQLHEERNTRSAEQGIEPTEFTLTGGYLGYDHTFNRLSVGVEYAANQVDYDNSIDENGNIINNADRDRRTQDLSARIGYQFKSDKQAFVRLGYQDVEYDQPVDDYGYARSSSGYYLQGGVNFTITGVLSGDAYLGYYQRDYDDPALPETDGWGLGAGLHWMPTMLTSVHVMFDTSVEDSALDTSSGYLRTLYSVRVDHELLRNLQITGQLSYYNNDYELLPGFEDDARSEDNYLTASVGANWFFNRWSWLSASYVYGNFDSNVPDDDFKANTFWLVLGLER